VLAGALGALRPLTGRVRAERVETVDVHDCRLGTRGEDDEVSIPPLELLERSQELVTLGTALRAANALLGLAAAQLELGDSLLRLLLRLRPALGDPLEQRLRPVA